MTRDKVITILEYKGELTFDAIESILKLFKEEIEQYNVLLVVEKRIYSILVECLENTYKHKMVSEADTKLQPVKLVLTERNGNFLIEVGNYIDNQLINNLIERINTINNLSREALNALYRESISKASISDKGGAGLGLIEIARNSRQKIMFELSDTQPDYSFFNFIVAVNKC